MNTDKFQWVYYEKKPLFNTNEKILNTIIKLEIYIYFEKKLIRETLYKKKMYIDDSYDHWSTEKNRTQIYIESS